MSFAIRTFTNVRARLFRVQDGKWLSGWVMNLAREEARIKLSGPIALTAGEQLVGECYGLGTVARFQGTLVGQAGLEIAIHVIGSVTFGPSEETPRIQTSGLHGVLHSGVGTSPLEVLDVSPESMGVVVSQPFEPGAELMITLPTEMGPIEGQVSVANCRDDHEREGHFRMGLHIVQLDRLARARWSRLVTERASGKAA